MYSAFNNFSNIQKSLIVSIGAVVLFIISASISYSVFPSGRSGGGVNVSGDLVTSLPGPANVLVEDPKEPRTEACPLNGDLHTRKAKDSWDKRRPLAVMIENHSESRPQSGLSSADVIYEAVAEGGITRFMALFYCNLNDIQVGPVRSARTYFLDWLSEYDPLYAHVGGANTMYSTTQKLWAVGAKKGWVNTDEDGIKWDKSFTPWKFKDPTPANPVVATTITVPFWQNHNDYTVTWIYEPTCNCYKRQNGGADHKDLNNNQQLSAKDIVIQFERESNANDGYENNAHLLYKTTGEGKALFFMDGKATPGKWIKLTRSSRTKYVDNKGKEIEFNKGVIWIQTVPEGAQVKY